MRDTATAQSVQPLFFGAPGQRLFGQYHPTLATGEADVHALLICSPFGHEALCAYRTMRDLAAATAAAGIPALRFDYTGSGNAEGDASDLSGLDAWVHNIVEAAAALRQLSGATHITLLGIRLGALLATLATPLCEAACDLIAIAPVSSGRAYLRELKALHLAGLAGMAQPPVSDTSDLFESGGFIMSAGTHQALSTVDLLRLDTPPLRQALLIDRDDLPVTGRLAVRWGELGVAVEQQAMSGYAEMMADPHHSQVPPGLLQAVLTRLKQAHAHHTEPEPIDSEPPTPICGPAVEIRSTQAHPASTCRETAAFFGDTNRLFGLLSEPVDEALRQRPHLGILILNAGAIRLVGPNGMYVPLARTWAAQGHTVLRVDIGGLGDSPPHAGLPDNIVYSDGALADVRAAIQRLRQQAGVDKVLVMGLCSGAYHAFKSAVQNHPVDALVMINPLTFFWKEGMSLDQDAVVDVRVAQDLMRHRRSMWQLATWLKLARGGVSAHRLKQIARQSFNWVCQKTYRAVARPLHLRIKDDLAQELHHVASRGVKQHFIFSDTDPGLELLRAFGGSAVERLQQRQQLGITLIPHADHTFTLAAPRQVMLQRLRAVVDDIATSFATKSP